MKKVNLADQLNAFASGKIIDSTGDQNDCFNFYDWFCKDASLERKANALFPKVKKFIAANPEIDILSTYVFFKNNCPMNGPLYNRIDGQVFFEWIKKYMSKRGQITERIQQDKQQGNNIYEIFQHPQMKEIMDDVADKLSIKEVPKVEAQRTKASPMEQMMMDEYDALPLWNDDMRFRVYNNRPYQFTEYRIERYRELIENQNEY